MNRLQSYIRHLKRRWYILVLLIADILVFFTVDPRQAPSVVLMIGLLLLIATIYIVICACLYLIGFGIPSLRKREKKLRILLSVVVAFLVGLQSLGQLTAKDFIAVIPLLLVGYFYLTYPNDQKVPEDRGH